jgi:hypothetical protein
MGPPMLFGTSAQKCKVHAHDREVSPKFHRRFAVNVLPSVSGKKRASSLKAAVNIQSGPWEWEQVLAVVVHVTGSNPDVKRSIKVTSSARELVRKRNQNLSKGKTLKSGEACSTVEVSANLRQAAIEEQGGKVNGH